MSVRWSAKIVTDGRKTDVFIKRLTLNVPNECKKRITAPLILYVYINKILKELFFFKGEESSKKKTSQNNIAN